MLGRKLKNIWTKNSAIEYLNKEKIEVSGRVVIRPKTVTAKGLKTFSAMDYLKNYHHYKLILL